MSKALMASAALLLVALTGCSRPPTDEDMNRPPPTDLNADMPHPAQPASK